MLARPDDERQEEADRRELRELAKNLCGAYGAGLDSVSILGSAGKGVADAKSLVEKTAAGGCLADRGSTGYKAIEIASMFLPPTRGVLKAGAERARRPARACGGLARRLADRGAKKVPRGFADAKRLDSLRERS